MIERHRRDHSRRRKQSTISREKGRKMPKLLECDCVEVCGWTKSHALKEEGVWWVCSNCGIELSHPKEEEILISFDCEIHGQQDWRR
jgi:transcription elongation factor Elf1